MNQHIETIRNTRSYLLHLTKDLPVEQLNNIPPGFNNNIIWNLGHLVASTQGVCYLRAGQKARIEESFYLNYKPDTKPTGFLDDAEVDRIKALLFSTLDLLAQDYEAGLFSNYTAWTTRYGVELATIDDALNFLQFHEGLHAGYVMALKRLATR